MILVIYQSINQGVNLASFYNVVAIILYRFFIIFSKHNGSSGTAGCCRIILSRTSTDIRKYVIRMVYMFVMNWSLGDFFEMYDCCSYACFWICNVYDV